jgi:hypothetical protein
MKMFFCCQEMLLYETYVLGLVDYYSCIYIWWPLLQDISTMLMQKLNGVTEFKLLTLKPKPTI